MAAEEQQQDGQKTLVAFIVGLLIGGMLVWAFGGDPATAPATETPEASEEATEDGTSEAETEANETNDQPASVIEAVREPAPTLSVGQGAVEVSDQSASAKIALESATYPVSEGWIGVREYNNDQLGYILGVVRFSESQGLVPNEIILQRATTPGNRYAIVIFTEDGDRNFNLANDVQIDQIFDTFVAK